MQAFLQRRRDEYEAAQQEIKGLSDELEGYGRFILYYEAKNKVGMT